MHRMNQSIIEKISNKIAPTDYGALQSWKPTEDFKKPFKELTQQLYHEIDSFKQDLQKHLEKKKEVDLLSKNFFFPVCRR